jgi:light-regulated signal transduction histidine kinase (bacteriophytochrome)
MQVAHEHNILQEKLSKTEAALEQVRADYEKFAYCVTHDLSAPLRHIDGFTQLALKNIGDDLDEDTQHFFSRMLAAQQKSKSLLDDLLLFSRINTRAAAPVQMNLKKLFEQCLMPFSATIKSQGMEVEVADLPYLSVDVEQMKLLFSSIIDNALKYATSTKPYLKVSAQQDNGLIELRFTDNGIGIEEKHHEKVFEPFRKARIEDGSEGNGIGLTLVRKIAQRHHGDAVIESNPEGGITVVVTLAE